MEEGEGDGGEGVCVVVEWRDNYLNCPVLPTPLPNIAPLLPSPPTADVIISNSGV